MPSLAIRHSTILPNSPSRGVPVRMDVRDGIMVCANVTLIFGLAGQLRGGAQMVQDEMPNQEVRPRAQIGRGFEDRLDHRFEKLAADDPGLLQRIARGDHLEADPIRLVGFRHHRRGDRATRMPSADATAS